MVSVVVICQGWRTENSQPFPVQLLGKDWQCADDESSAADFAGLGGTFPAQHGTSPGRHTLPVCHLYFSLSLFYCSFLAHLRWHHWMWFRLVQRITVAWSGPSKPVLLKSNKLTIVALNWNTFACLVSPQLVTSFLYSFFILSLCKTTVHSIQANCHGSV